MSWLELDDQILEHPKFIRAVKIGGSDAVFTWLGLRAYCAQKLSDGEIPADMIDEIRGPRESRKRAAAIAALVEVGLVETTDNGLRLHDYLHWSRSKEEIETRRQANAGRQRRHREQPIPVTRDNDVTNTLVTPSVTIPSPLPSPPILTTPIRSEQSASVPEEPPTPPPVLVFPTAGKPETWALTEPWLSEARTAFPRFDVLADLRVALAKLNTGATGKKTARGMPKFLMAWLGRTNDRLGTTSKPPVPDGRCDWHRESRNDPKPSKFPRSTCQRCKHFAASAGVRAGPPVDIGELAQAKTRELEVAAEKARSEAAERFRRQREAAEGKA